MIDLGINDFGVMLRPILDREGEDSSFGNLEVAVFSNLMPEVDDELHAQYMFVAYKMAAMLSFCEENPEFDDMLNEYTESLVSQLSDKEDDEPLPTPKATVSSKVGNVITLDFNTVCEGEG
tara:strand:- start:8579 stop:8941 length:363 start_codon:yes stop_codon:yes gene_type:complete